MLRINSPCRRWRPGRWHQQRPSRCFLFFLAQVREYLIDDALVLDTCDDPDRSATKTTDLDIDIENSLQALRPRHCRMTLGRCPYCRICVRFQRLATPGRRDLAAPAVVRGEDAVVTGEVHPRPRYERCQTSNKVDRKVKPV